MSDFDILKQRRYAIFNPGLASQKLVSARILRDVNDYDSIFATLDLDDSTLAIDHGETIKPTLAGTPRTQDAMATLPEYTLESETEANTDFRIVEKLGEGGMGVVSLAEQTALRRLVAVKEPKGDSANSRVLDEAFIMGRMEHPNVVPAYSLGRRENGRPILVMKRVEGISWEDVLTGKAEPPAGDEADLSWHLRVILQVCNALRFAHARHVVHRDIKPENVMIGEFGEVYLLDWGIALSLDANADEGIPTRETAGGPAGTPAFMAPEMTGDDAMDIDERTDVYLLGANLHMVLTGAPPHSGETLFAIFMAAFKSEPLEYADDIPSDLVAIVHKAMAREKDDRFASVFDFAAAILDFLEHRASYVLSDASRDMLNEVQAADQDEDVTNRLLEAEFGFRQALTIWEGNRLAKDGLQESIEVRVRSCIAREEVGGARAALDQLPVANPALEEELRELESELEARAKRVNYLERFELELGLKTGTRSRQRAAIVIGLGFTALCYWQAWVARPGELIAPVETWLDSFWRLVAIAAIGIVLFWKKLVANIANRRLVVLMLSALGGMYLLRLGAISLDASETYVQIAELIVIGMAAFAIGVASNRLLAVVAGLVYPAAVLVSIEGGEMWVALLALGTAHLVFFGVMAWTWRPSLTRKDD